MLPTERIDPHSVSTLVNAAKYEEPECIRTVAHTSPPGSYYYFDDDFFLYPLAFMQSSNTCCLLSPPAKVASRSHSYKSRL